MKKRNKKEKIDFKVYKEKLPKDFESKLESMNESELFELIRDRTDDKTWYDDLVRKSKCDVCGLKKPLQWDTPEGRFCHDCLCNSEQAFKIFINHFEKYGDDNDNGVEYELFTSKKAMIKNRNKNGDDS